MLRALIISICFSLLVGCNTLSDAQKAEGQGKKVSYQAPFNKTWDASIKALSNLKLNVAKQETSVNIVVKTLGGGYSAQADAARHGISRALVAFDEQFRTILKPYGLLTRDSRSVERKKYGKKKARKSSQFSKR